VQVPSPASFLASWLPNSNALVVRVAALSLLTLSSCKPPTLAPDAFGNVRADLPDWPDRKAEGTPGAGSLTHSKKGAGRVVLSWEADSRLGLPGDEEVMLAAALGKGAHVSTSAKRSAGAVGAGFVRGPVEVQGHPAALVDADGGQALVWRCDKTGRLLRLLREGDGTPWMEAMAPSVKCHQFKDHAADGDVPAASASLLGAAWRLAKRNPASAVWLKDEAVLTLFAAQIAPLPVDLVEAAHLVPAWAVAAGLKAPEVRTGVRAVGPQGHPALRFEGDATLDGHAVRFSFLWWRCQARARTYGALVVTEEKAAKAAGGPLAPPAPATAAPQPPAQSGWTGHDGVLLAGRCHG
jgi:hypothetical protein